MLHRRGASRAHSVRLTSWEPAGNLTLIDPPGAANTQAFTLDAFDRITSATLGGTSVGYTLDAFSRVMTRTQGSEVTTLTYEGISEQLASSTTGTTTTTYANTPGGPLGERVGTGTRMLYLRDLHDDVVGLVEATATAPSARAYYSAWGEPTWEDGTSALGFQSQYTDPGTGFVDMTTRSCVPSLGRFASRDIVFGGLRNAVSLNQWAYAEGDPLTNTDPLGMVITKDADPPDGCAGLCASDGVEPSEHGNPETGTTTEQRIFEYLIERPVQAYLYFGATPEDTSWQSLVAEMAGRALDSIAGPYCPGGRALCNWIPSLHERAMIQRIQALATADREIQCRAGVVCSLFTASGYGARGVVAGLMWAGEHKCEVAGHLSYFPDGTLDVLNVINWANAGMWSWLVSEIEATGDASSWASRTAGAFSRTARWVGGVATAADLLCRAY